MRRRGEQPLQVAGPVSIARLHGRACWYCGAVAQRMTVVGRVQRAPSKKVWIVVSCGCHQHARVAR